MKSPEFSSPRVQAGIVGFVGAFAIGGCCGESPHPSLQPESGGVCESPSAYSPLYKGNPNAKVDHSNWTWVVADLQNTPDGVGYRATYGSSEAKQGGKRGLVTPDKDAQERGLAFSIGKGDVMFGITVVAALGSRACDVAPDVRFSEVMPNEPVGVVKPDL